MWILIENFIVLTLFYGDASYPAWKRIGDISSSLYALGWHSHVKTAHEVPRWLTELRKQNVIFAYAIDKSMAVFVGRPPRISQRYVRLDIPMFLEDDVLAWPPADLERLIAEKGDKIWEADNLTSFSSNAHANRNCFILREEILELFLSTPESISQENLEARIADVSERSRQEWNIRQDKFRYDVSVWTSSKPPGMCCCTRSLLV